MNLADLIQQHARAEPEAKAVVTPKGDLSRGALDRLVCSAALQLRERGLRAGDRASLAIRDPVLHLVASLAMTRVGVAQVVLPPGLAPDAERELFKRLGLANVVVDARLAQGAPPGAVAVGGAGHPRTRTPHAADSNDPGLAWLLLQSSGTTGEPKHAVLTHAAAFERFQRYRSLFDCNAKDRFWAASKLDFVVAKQRTIYCLLAGATVCLPGDGGISQPTVEFLAASGVTLGCGTPAHLHQLVEVGRPMPSLRAFEARSAAISEKIRRQFKDVVSPHLHVVYGTNEGDGLAIAPPPLQGEVPGTVGRAAPGIDIEVVDENYQVLPPGKTGLVRARGSGVISCYVDAPDADARAFMHGWFYPGDMGYLTPSGALVLQGRCDDLMIYDGMNIYPAEIENALLLHPSVREAAAFPLPHERYQEIPVAAVTVTSPTREQELISYCVARLGRKSPRRVFVMASLPTNSMGKTLKRELRESIYRAVNIKNG